LGTAFLKSTMPNGRSQIRPGLNPSTNRLAKGYWVARAVPYEKDTMSEHKYWSAILFPNAVADVNTGWIQKMPLWVPKGTLRNTITDRYVWAKPRSSQPLKVASIHYVCQGLLEYPSLRMGYYTVDHSMIRSSGRSLYPQSGFVS